MTSLSKFGFATGLATFKLAKWSLVWVLVFSIVSLMTLLILTDSCSVLFVELMGVGVYLGWNLSTNGLIIDNANLFMDRFETKALASYPLKPLIWKRFIDDIFLIWTHVEESLNKFVQHLISLHPTIKFTSEFSKESINFLDTTVKLDKSRHIITTLYNKPTDTHLFLHHTSAHPDNIMKKGPYGQYLRIRRICSLDSDFIHNADKLTEYYLKRGYPLKKLRKHFQKVSKFTQKELLDANITVPKPTPPVMVTQFNPQNPLIKNFIHKNWNIIEHCEELKQSFTQKPLIGFRRLPNLRDILTSNKISFPPSLPSSVTEKPKVCTRLGKCTYCPKLTKISMFTSHHTGKQHKCINLHSKPLITCEISNIVYLIQCTKCGKQYIGETGRPFRNRIYEHIASVKNNKKTETPVSKHFHSEHHNHNNMRFSVIQWLGTTINPQTQEVRRAKELSFIWELPTINPIGINQFV